MVVASSAHTVPLEGPLRPSGLASRLTGTNGGIACAKATATHVAWRDRESESPDFRSMPKRRSGSVAWTRPSVRSAATGLTRLARRAGWQAARGAATTTTTTSGTPKGTSAGRACLPRIPGAGAGAAGRKVARGAAR